MSAAEPEASPDIEAEVEAPSGRSWRDDLEERHRRAGLCLMWALTAREKRASAQLLLETYLTETERLEMLALMIRAADFEEADMLMDLAVRRRNPGPPPAFGPLREDAEDWASWASMSQVKAFLMACFYRLPEIERVKFLAAAQRTLLK